jgi:hypothetical protein
MTEKSEVNFCILIDENGDYAIGGDENDAAERYADDIGGDDALAKRHIKLTLSIPLPKPVEVSGEISETGSEFKLSVDPVAA